MDRQASVAAAARRQYGLVTYAQARQRGWSEKAIRGAVSRGAWIPVRPGVYEIAGSPRTWEQTVMAACLAGGDGTWASHETSGILWVLAKVPRTEAIHLVSGPERRIRLDGITAHRSILLPAVDLTRRRHIPTVTAARAIVEISGRMSVERCGEMLDDAARRRLASIHDVRACVARLAGPGRRRLRMVRQVLAQRLPGYNPGDSDLEIRALRAIVAAGNPLPVQQHRVRLAGKRRYIDLAYPDDRIAIELDSWEFHRWRTAFDGDRAKASELVATGWRVLTFTDTTPDAVMGDQVRRTRSIALVEQSRTS